MTVLKVALLALLFVGALHLTAGSSDASEADKSAAKLAQLQRLSAGGVMSLGGASFNRVVRSSNRLYDAVVLFTTRNPGHRCSVCSDFEREFAVAAESYWRLTDAQRGQTVPVIFGVADFDSNQEAFKLYALKSVPVVMFVKHGEDETSTPIVFGGALDAESVGSFVQQHNGSRFPIYRSPWAGLFMMITFFAVSGTLLWLGREHIYAGFMKFRENRMFWLGLCLLTYFASVSGVVYDIIRTPPPFYLTESGIAFIHPSSGQQFVFEGLFVGGLNVACAGAVVALTLWASKMSKEISFIVLGIFCMLYFIIVRLYKYKSPWY